MKKMAIDMNIPESEDSLSVSEAARMIQCSRSKLYRYIKQGRLSSHKVSRGLRLSKNEVRQLQVDLSKETQTRAKAPPGKPSSGHEELITITIHVPIWPGKQAQLEQRFAEEEGEQRYRFTGSTARYILGDDEGIEMILIWKKEEMPDEAIWQSDLHLFQQAFADLLAWEQTTLSFGKILRYR